MKCEKHPDTDLEIRKGKRNQKFVVCPKCKPNESKPDTKPADQPATTPEQKKNEQRPWYDRSIFG